MGVTEFYALLDGDIFASVLGFGFFAWVSGYCVGKAMGVTRKLVHMGAS